MLAVHLNRLMFVFITVLIPEVILANAVQQFLSAWTLSNALEIARKNADDQWEKKTSAYREVHRACGSILLWSGLLLILIWESRER